MKWTYKEPSAGDMIRVAVGSIYHFGVYVSDEEVIQFGLPPARRGLIDDADIEVISSSIDGFLAGGFLEVCEFDKKEKKKNRPPEQVVAYARSKIGSRGYHILYNNCEHFANECVSGVQVCRQAEDLRELLRKMPIVDVYIAEMPSGEPEGKIECKQRAEEIASVGESALREKYFVWQLLCYALERSLGIRGKKQIFSKEKCGAWTVEGAEISLSHCGSAIAVAVSRAAVGVDIEPADKSCAGLDSSQWLTAEEQKRLSELSGNEREEELLKVWTAKEALFKSKKLQSFIPKDQNTISESFKTDSVTLGGKKHFWSVATATPDKVRLFTGIDLAKIK